MESYAPHRIKDAAYRIFRTDWPCAVEALKTRKIIVDGYCPDCGERLDEKSVTKNVSYDWPGDWWNYETCPKCNYTTRER